MDIRKLIKKDAWLAMRNNWGKAFAIVLISFSFLIFTLLYTPCVAAVSAVKREMGSVRNMLAVVLFQTGLAWAAACIVYQAGRLFGL